MEDPETSVVRSLSGAFLAKKCPLHLYTEGTLAIIAHGPELLCLLGS